MLYDWIGALTHPPRRLRRLRRISAMIPRPVAFSLVTLAGWGVFLLAGSFRRRIMSNVGELLPQIAGRRRRQFCRRYIVHECLTIHEQVLEYKRALRVEGGVRFHVDGAYHLDDALRLGRGAIVYTPHVGNYFYSYWRLAQEYPCVTVVTAGDPALRRLFLGFRRLRLRAWEYDREPPMVLMRRLQRHLERNGVVYLLSDYSRPHFDDVTLFGKPSKVPAGAVAMSLRSRVPIVPFVGCREGWSDHRMTFRPALHLYERYGMAQRAEAMREMARGMEKLILHAPHQWLYWFNVHERWASSPAITEDA